MLGGTRVQVNERGGRVGAVDLVSKEAVGAKIAVALVCGIR
jgi:hypothetical protein